MGELYLLSPLYVSLTAQLTIRSDITERVIVNFVVNLYCNSTRGTETGEYANTAP